MIEPFITTPTNDGGSLPKIILSQKFTAWTTTNIRLADGKYDKVPVRPDGKFCSGELASHGRSYSSAVSEVYGLDQLTPEYRSWASLKNRKAGIGLIMESAPVSVTPDEKPLFLLALDWDKSVNGDQPSTDVQTDIDILGGSERVYFEKSPSGQGIRGFVLTLEPGPSHNLGTFECYSSKRMMTVTGRGGKGALGVVSLEAVWEVIARHGGGKPSIKSGARDGLEMKAVAELNADLTAHLELPPLPELKNLLSSIPAAKANGMSRDKWRNVIWAARSGYGKNAQTRQHLIDWCESAPGELDQNAFDAIWNRADRDGGDAIGVGSLLHMANLGKVATTSSTAGFINCAEGDVANGRVFADTHRGKLIFLADMNAWYRFDAKVGWLPAVAADIDRAAKDVAYSLLDKAFVEIKADPNSRANGKMLQRAQKVHNLQPMKAMIEMAKSELGMSCAASDFDSDPMQLGVQNGVINLNKGKLLSVSPQIRVSKRCAVVYDPDAKCPRFEQFLLEVMPEPDVQLFIQRWIGYCLTGRSTEKKLLMLFGVGDNGKSILIEVLNWLLGTYATKIETEMLMRHIRTPQGASPDIVALKGTRLAFANETNEGQRLDDARVKGLSGGDTLTGRVPYGKAAITFEPSHKLMIAGNHKPVITDTSGGMWGRVVLIPFDVVIPTGQRDRHLLDKLKQEGSGILNWALAGLADYLANGLKIPACLEAATQVYRDDQDLIGEWISDHCVRGSGRRCAISDAYKAFRHWCMSNGHGTPSKTTLTRRLGSAGITQTPDRRNYTGISLNTTGLAASR